MTLQSGGTRRPWFLIHPVGGSVFCYTDLVRALGPDQPVYGLQAPEGEGAAPASLEEMASRYLEALRAAQPEGPYRLGGWSMGGVVAYEIARQLAARREEVEQLAVLDVSAPCRGETAEEATIRAWFARDLAGLLGKPLPAQLGDLPADAPLSEAFARASDLGLLPSDLDFTATARRFDLFRANLRLIERYAPGPYPGSIQLFRADASHFDDPETRPSAGPPSQPAASTFTISRAITGRWCAGRRSRRSRLSWVRGRPARKRGERSGKTRVPSRSAAGAVPVAESI
ncbi:MAG TPA: thioesterase domain-containing protein [Thermoanaerobaculia bacterium]|nr:thioesterase domain-containing protein [Thermoanaerobaculia bacterium]